MTTGAPPPDAESTVALTTPNDHVSIVSSSPVETQRIAAWLADRLFPSAIVLLDGDLGAGKTTFAQGFAAAYGVLGPIPSPTFTIINEYEGDQVGQPKPRLFHIDLYRLTNLEDLESIGWDELLAIRDAVTLVEWPRRAQDHLPEDALIVRFDVLGPDTRRITLVPLGSPPILPPWPTSLEAALKTPPNSHLLATDPGS